MSEQVGKKIWVFPDGEMPLPGKFPVKGHESIIILNPSDEPAICKLSIYYTDREPYSDIVVRVEPRRARPDATERGNPAGAHAAAGRRLQPGVRRPRMVRKSGPRP